MPNNMANTAPAALNAPIYCGLFMRDFIGLSTYAANTSDLIVIGLPL